MEKNNNTNIFASRMGAILAAAGSAVGLGNVWRFPTETGANGGAAFLIIYIGFMLLLGVPIMVTEFTIGRYGGSDVTNAFRKLSGGSKAWACMGLVPLVSGIIILSYYAVVAGWTLYYAYVAVCNGFTGKSPAEYADDFVSFSGSTGLPIMWMMLIIVMTGAVVAMGVQKGIERGAKLMMPLLFVFILILVCCSLSLPNSMTGVRFLLEPDFSKVTGKVLLSAMGQAFFSLSVGIGCLCTYACYFRRDVNLVSEGFSVATIDTFVAILSGLIIFPAVYSIPGLQPDAGPALVFITLPNVFQSVFGGMPVLAYSFSLIFYLLLVMAALTSSVSMLEMPVAYCHKRFGWSRPFTAVAVSVVCIILGTCCSLSFGEWSDVTLFGMGIFDFFDFLIAKFVMPIGGMLMCFFLGWVVDEKLLHAEITNGDTVRQPLYPVFRFILRYFAPLCIALIFMNELQILTF